LPTAIFDMDGTLINSSKPIVETINYVRDNLNLEPLEFSKALSLLNRVDINPALEFYGSEKFTEQQRVLFEDYYIKICREDIYLYDGVDRLLKDLKSNSYKLAVATNASSLFAKEMLDSLNILDSFDFIVGAEKIKPKPEPDMLFEIIKNLDSNIEKTHLVGDSPKDLLSAKSAKINPILVSWGFTEHEKSEHLVDSTDEVFKRIIEH